MGVSISCMGFCKYVCNWKTGRADIVSGHIKLLQYYRVFFRRKLNDELCEMIGEVIIHSDLLKHQRKLSYKYTVFSPKAKVEDDCYEYLYDYGGSGNVNRCLQLSLQQYSEHQGELVCTISRYFPNNTTTIIISINPVLYNRYHSAL